MWSFFSSLASGLMSGLVQPFFGYMSNRDTLNEKGFEVGAASDTQVQIAYMQTQLQMAQLQASTNQWWGARLIILVTAAACAAHFCAVMIDTTPIFGHVVGSWSVPKLPAPYDDYEAKILLSFFIITPAAPVFSAVASWLHRK